MQREMEVHIYAVISRGISRQRSIEIRLQGHSELLTDALTLDAAWEMGVQVSVMTPYHSVLYVSDESRYKPWPGYVYTVDDLCLGQVEATTRENKVKEKSFN